MLGSETIVGPRTTRSVEDERQFRALVQQHMPYVWRQLRLLGTAERDLEDGCQEVFVIVHRRLPEFEGRSSLRTWIHRVAYWVASNHKKRARRQKELPYEQPPEQVVTAGPHAELETERAWQKLLGLLDQFPHAQRQVFVLFEIQGLPMREIIELLGCSSSTAYAWLDAARESLRNGLTPSPAAEEP